MTHRRLAQDMFERSLRSVLVLECEIEVMDTGADLIDVACRELALRPWQVLHTGCWHDTLNLPEVKECNAIRESTSQPRGGGYALHISALPALLQDMPANFGLMQDWILGDNGIDAALARLRHMYAVAPGATTLPMHLPYQPLAYQERFAA